MNMDAGIAVLHNIQSRGSLEALYRSRRFSLEELRHTTGCRSTQFSLEGSVVFTCRTRSLRFASHRSRPVTTLSQRILASSLNATTLWFGMSSFEVIIAVVQTGVFIAALIVAARQTKLTREQAAISRKQAEISETMLNLHYALSVHVEFDAGEMAPVLRNHGQTNIYYSGYSFHKKIAMAEGPPRAIPPNTSFLLPGNWVEILDMEDCVSSGNAWEPRAPKYYLEIFLRDERGVGHVVGTMMLVDIEERRWSIRCTSTAAQPA